MAVTQLVKKLIRPEIQEIAAYPVPSSAGMVKLDAMESPYSWDAAMQKVWLARAKDISFNRYPDAAANKLRSSLTAWLDLPREQEILFGNGSDELIQILMMAVANDQGGVLAVSPSFVMYEMTAKFVGLDFHNVSLNPDFSLDLAATLAKIKQIKPALTFLAYPNNPTGNSFKRSDIEAIIKASDGLVVVDEAYSAFAADSFIDDVAKYPNLIVMRTFSKVGLAGLRLGYLVAHKDLVVELDKVRMPYNINALTQEAVAFALENYEKLEAQAEQIKQDRELLAAELAAFAGIEVFATQANFILFRLNRAVEVFNGLKERNVLIRNLSSSGGLLENCLRVSVGSPAENSAFLKALTEVMQELG